MLDWPLHVIYPRTTSDKANIEQHNYDKRFRRTVIRKKNKSPKGFTRVDFCHATARLSNRLTKPYSYPIYIVN